MNDFEKLLIGEIHGIRKALQTIASGLQGGSVGDSLKLNVNDLSDLNKISENIQSKINQPNDRKFRR